MSERMNVVSKAIATIEPAPLDAHDPVGSFHVLLSTAAEDRDGDTLALDEWETPLPEHITFDSDHMMNVAGTVGSGRPVLTERGIEVTGTYSSIPEAQKVRTLVNEGHIRTTSVAFMVKKVGKGPGARTVRELLNGAFVAVPSNRDALVLSHKGVTQKVGQRNSASDQTAIQSAHDLMASLGAECDATESSQTTGRGGTDVLPHVQVGPPPAPVKSVDKPHGDVLYADPGYQPDGKHRYPLDTEAHVRAAWSYINQTDNQQPYTADQLSKIKDAIRAAARRFGVNIDESKSFSPALVEVPAETSTPEDVPTASEPSEADDAWLLNSQATILAALAAS